MSVVCFSQNNDALLPTVLFGRIVMGAEKKAGMGTRKFPRLVMKNRLLQSAADVNYASIQSKQG